jgi:hypothetical protein
MKIHVIAALSLMLVACTQNPSAEISLLDGIQKLYATKGDERQVSFKAFYKTSYTEAELEEVKTSPDLVSRWEIASTVKFLFGPLVNHELGGPQRGEVINILNQEAVVKDGVVFVPYEYSALWLIYKEFPSELMTFPVPFQRNMQHTPEWKLCGDAEPEHQTAGFFWYFWDPSRSGCDQQLGVDYQNVELKFGDFTVQTTRSYPEYSRMVRTINGEKVLQMTFAFGYVSDKEEPKPFSDFDEGMREFRSFHKKAEKVLPVGFQTAPIMQSEYDGSETLQIGTRYTAVKDGVKIELSIVAAAGVDQMMLFAESYAHRKEAFFGWFGHSRVGSGFDAQQFQYIMQNQPERFSLTDDYQMIYWAGCNSYSYYTLPFFDMKAQLNPTLDPKGTKNLDIVSNGLPSFFSLNAANGEIMLKALMKWRTPTSYQTLVDALEKKADRSGGTLVLVNVLGDEDNQSF